MTAINLYPGQRFEGRGECAGLALTVIAVEPETEHLCCKARVRIDSISHAELAHLRDRAANNPHEPSRRSIAEYLAKVEVPHVECREREWFVQWLKHGLIREVSAVSGAKLRCGQTYVNGLGSGYHTAPKRCGGLAEYSSDGEALCADCAEYMRDAGHSVECMEVNRG